MSLHPLAVQQGLSVSISALKSHHPPEPLGQLLLSVTTSSLFLILILPQDLSPLPSRAPRQKEALGLPFSMLLHRDNGRNPVDGPELPVASRQVLRKRAGLGLVSSQRLCWGQEECSGQPQAPCDFQAAPDKIAFHWRSGRLWFGWEEGKKGGHSARSSFQVLPEDFCTKNWTTNY